MEAHSSLGFGPWLRNALIGAALVSIKALFALAGGLMREDLASAARAGQAALFLAAAGAVGGCVFTALGPLRRRGGLARYLGWTLTVWVVLAVVIVAGTRLFPDAKPGEPDVLVMLSEPLGIAFWLAVGTVLGVFLARVAERWARD
ncbi:MAG TPA: hypothetical protein VNL18_08190 [Gemmatimonadales bacterium]|nr:hypothetical protein [Gemmatimonadales bacterium]